MSRIRTKTINSDFNAAFAVLVERFGYTRIGQQVSVWIDKMPKFSGPARERQKQWANIMQSVITCCVLAERGSVEMTRQQDYQGRGLGLCLHEKFVEEEREVPR